EATDGSEFLSEIPATARHSGLEKPLRLPPSLCLSRAYLRLDFDDTKYRDLRSQTGGAKHNRSIHRPRSHSNQNEADFALADVSRQRRSASHQRSQRKALEAGSWQCLRTFPYPSDKQQRSAEHRS